MCCKAHLKCEECLFELKWYVVKLQSLKNNGFKGSVHAFVHNNTWNVTDCKLDSYLLMFHFV